MITLFGKPEPTLLERLKESVSRTRSELASRVEEIFTGQRQIDPALLAQHEHELLAADLGVRTTREVLAAVREKVDRKALTDVAQLKAELKAQLLGINTPDVFSALQIFLGSAYVNDFNLFGRTFRVTAQATADARLETKDVLKIRVRNSAGETVPLGSFTTVRDISGPYRVPRYNLYPTAELDGAAAPGYSQGQAIQIMQKLAAETLPEGFAYEWTNLAFQQQRAGNTAVFAFVLAVVFVFLVLAA